MRSLDDEAMSWGHVTMVFAFTPQGALEDAIEFMERSAVEGFAEATKTDGEGLLFVRLDQAFEFQREQGEWRDLDDLIHEAANQKPQREPE